MEGLSTILTDIGTFFTQSLGWVTSILDKVVTSPALFIMVVCMPVAGIGYGFLKRLLAL